MNPVRQRQNTGGFTLIEVLVATALLAVSMTLVLGVYRSVFSVVEQVDRKAAFQSRTALVIDQLQRDFFGMYKGKSGFFRAGNEAGQGGDILLCQFTTTSRLQFGVAGPSEAVTVVRYRLEKAGDSRNYHLYRYEVPLFYGLSGGSLPDPSDILVHERVVDLKLSFKDRYGSFIERWDARSSAMQDGPDDDRFPRLVRIELELAEGTEQGAMTRTLSQAIAIPRSRYAAQLTLEES